MRKVCVVTGTRAEYGLLYWLMKEIEQAEDLELQLVVTGMHLSQEFGCTDQQIDKDGFTIDKKVEMLLSSDSEVAVTKSLGIGVQGFADALNDLQSDILVLLGDRFEIFSAASASMIAGIPIAHLHGGELTEGVIDDAIRHSITKMSHLHFTATDAYRKRVIQLGEQPERVFNVGGLGGDNIKRMELLSKKAFQHEIGFALGEKNLLVTFHPETLDKDGSREQFSNLLMVLSELEDVHVIFTKANADAGGKVINHIIDDFVLKHSNRMVAYESLGQLRYLSAMQFVDGVVGNSSSGLLEAPSFKIGTVNIGERQRGRVRAKSIIDSGSSKEEIASALRKLFSPEFKRVLDDVENPYGDGGAATKVVEKLRNTPLQGILKKSFYDCC